MEHGKKASEISVVVPVYNVEKYLHECLESLLTQTFESMEVICVDDGSKDSSGKICDEYALKDERIKVIHQNNQGAGAARNKGLVRAEGRYIAFLDADDMYRSDALAKAYTQAEGNNADIVLFGAVFTDRDGSFLQEEKVNIAPLLGRKVIFAKEVSAYLYQITSCNPWNKLFRREFILERGLQFQTLRTANDLYFTSIALARAERIAVLPEPLAIHRMRNSGNLQTLKKETPLDFLLALEQIKADLYFWNLWEIFEQSFVNFALEHCAYNYRTLNKEGRRELIRENNRLCKLLKLQEQKESYYYKRNSYREVCQWLHYGKGYKHMGIFTRFKEFLKRVFPPPVKTFNREMEHIQWILTQQQSQIVQQQKQMAQQLIQQLTQQQKQINEQQHQLKSLAGNLSSIGGQLTRIEVGTKRTTPQPRLSYFVLNILSHCNLRCKGCDHFACIAEEHFVSLENIKKDVARMSELLHGAVTRIGVMGGEPLLHPDLIEILAATRTAFPNSIIQLVTNGILLLRMDEDFWKCCRENNILIANTKYPINQDYEKMQRTAEDHGVKFEFFGSTGEVQKTSYKIPLDVSGRQNPVDSFWTCYHANNCCLLEEGKLYTCTITPNIHHFNKKFGTNMELQPEDYLDIYKAQSADEVYNFLATPKPFCRYCMTSKRTFGHPWERSKQEMSEWLSD